MPSLLCRIFFPFLFPFSLPVAGTYRVPCGIQGGGWQKKAWLLSTFQFSTIVTTFPTFHKSLKQMSSKINLPLKPLMSTLRSDHNLLILQFSHCLTPITLIPDLQLVWRGRRERNCVGTGDTTVNRSPAFTHTWAKPTNLAKSQSQTKMWPLSTFCYSVSIGLSMLYSNRFIFSFSYFQNLFHSPQATFPTRMSLNSLNLHPTS